MNTMMQCTMRERELRDSGSIANNKVCFEVRATALVPAFTQKDFHYIVHTGLPTQGTSTEDLGKIQLGVHSSSLQQIQPLHKRQDTTTITSTLRRMGT